MSEPKPLKDSMREAFERAELSPGLDQIERRLTGRRKRRRASLTATGLVMLTLVAVGGWWGSGERAPIASPELPTVPGALEEPNADLPQNAVPSERLRQVAEITPVSDVETLTFADGGSLEEHLATDPGILRFSDGSELELASLSRLRAVEVVGAKAEFELMTGRVRFDIRPGGPRQWSVRAGAMTVSVLGTSFSVIRSGARVEVEVHRGVVSVSTEAGARSLYAGESFAIGQQSPAVHAQAQGRPTRRPASPSAEPDSASQRPSGESHSDDHASLSPPLTPVAELIGQADRARREGDRRGAIVALRTIAIEHPQSDEAPAAAVSWGRLEQELGHHREAIGAYRRVIEGRAVPAMRELAHERIVRAHFARGDRPAAQVALRDYLRAFPDGASAEQLQHLLQ